MLKIKNGSVFDEKCDLLILPCDSHGGVTSWVLNEIKQNDIPFPRVKIPYGKIRFSEAGSSYEKSDFVGFAASVEVETITSSVTAIRTIALDIVRFCKETGCSIVNLPLLGTGAGRLNPADVLKVFEEIFKDDTYISQIGLSQIFF